MIEGHSSVANSQTRDFRDCAVLIREKVSLPNAGDVPYIGLEHIGKETLSLVGHGESNSVTSAKARFRRGDILFGKLRPYFRKIVRAPFDGICSTDIWVVRAAEGVDQEFLFYCMASWPFVDFATAGAEGTRMPRAKWEHISRYEIFLPPLPEQRAIAHILGTLDDKIELNRRMNQTLEEMARALFKSWFVDFDPVRAKMDGRWRRGHSLPGMPADLYDLFPDRLVGSELGEIPEGWVVRPFGALLEDVIGGDWGKEAPDGVHTEPVSIIRGTDLPSLSNGGTGSVPLRYTTIKKAERRKLKSGDIVIEVSGGSPTQPTGRSMIITQNVLDRFQGAVVCASFCRRFRPRGWREALIASWHLDFIRSIGKMWYYQLQSTGIANFQTKQFLQEENIIWPEDAPLDRYTEIVEPIVRLMAQNDNITLAAQRDVLLPKLISGELRVKSWNAVKDSTDIIAKENNL